jgi:hypothetical protein
MMENASASDCTGKKKGMNRIEPNPLRRRVKS